MNPIEEQKKLIQRIAAEAIQEALASIRAPASSSSSLPSPLPTVAHVIPILLPPVPPIHIPALDTSLSIPPSISNGARAEALASMQRMRDASSAFQLSDQRDWVSRNHVVPGTASGYASALKVYGEWCEERFIMNHREYSEGQLSAYLRWMGDDGRGADSISTFMSAVRRDIAYEVEAGTREDTTRRLLVIQSVKIVKEQADASNPKLPLTWEMIKRVSEGVVLGLPGRRRKWEMVRDTAMMVLAMLCFLRASEVAMLVDGDVWLEWVHRGSVRTVAMKVFVRKSKTDQRRIGAAVVVATRWGEKESVQEALCRGCPAAWLCWYRLCRSSARLMPIPGSSEGDVYRDVQDTSMGAHGLEEIRLPRQERRAMDREGGDEPLFTQKGESRHLSKGTPCNRFKAALDAIGLDGSKYGGHSARSGGATEARAGGADALAVKAHGRWKSDVFQGYVRADTEIKLGVTNFVTKE